MRKIFLSIALSLTLTTPAFAGLNVLATLPWIGSAAKEIGKDKINVTVLAKPSQDAHFLEAKPSMILSARKADIIMYDGLDLEIGYLPLVIESSKNPKLMPGQPGNFDCSQFITASGKADQPWTEAWETCIRSAIPITIFRRQECSALPKA